VLDSFTDDEVKQALESLPEAFRMAVLLADVEASPTRRSPKSWKFPIGTVMSRLHRGRRALQKRCTNMVCQGLVAAEP